MAVKARMGAESLRLVLDSGSNHVVLFRLPAAMEKIHAVSTTMKTIEGARSIVPTRWTAEMSLADHVRFQTLPAAIVPALGRQVEGLFPASAFKKIYVDQERQELVVVR